MARRSKEDALATRNSLLDAAERVFLVQGVAGTSLQDIAVAAGTTRGAIYWHFKDKGDLFNAMLDRIVMPLQVLMGCAASPDDADPLTPLKRALRQAMRQTVTDPQTRRVFEVATHKVEYVDSLCAVRDRHMRMRQASVERFRVALLRGAAFRGVRLPLPGSQAAQGLQSMIDGLFQNWLLDPTAFDLEAVGMKTVDVYLRGLGLE
jgi:TetR/AcrR family acrAB operon transcriptional repressor